MYQEEKETNKGKAWEQEKEMKTLTKEDKKYIQQVLFALNSTNTRSQEYWDMLDEIKDAETSVKKTKRQQEIIEYIDSIGGYED